MIKKFRINMMISKNQLSWIKTSLIISSFSCKTQDYGALFHLYLNFPLLAGGELYAWGSNLSGQLGLGHREGPQKDPILIKSLLGVPLVHITAGGQHSAALTQAGFLLTWGSNKYGQLGFSSNKDDLYWWVVLWAYHSGPHWSLRFVKW